MHALPTFRSGARRAVGQGPAAPLIGHRSGEDCVLSEPQRRARSSTLTTRWLLLLLPSPPRLLAIGSLALLCLSSVRLPQLGLIVSSKLSAAMAAVASTSAVASACLVHRAFAPQGLRAASARPVAGLPALRRSRIVCSAEKKKESNEGTGLPQLAAAVTSATTLAYAHPVFALVDERLSTEGTGLGLGLSNPKLAWILVGVTALIWALYFTYASKLPDSGDDSGLDL